MGLLKDGVNSATRYYLNHFVDPQRNEAVNFFISGELPLPVAAVAASAEVAGEGQVGASGPGKRIVPGSEGGVGPRRRTLALVTAAGVAGLLAGASTAFLP